MVTHSLRSGTFVVYLRFLLFVCIGIGYILSPFDLISESTYGLIGCLDDIIFILSILVYVSMAYYRVLNREAAGENAG
jgi:RING finger protein 170